MVLFFKKEGNKNIPVDIVQKLASQGRSEAEIITQLRSQGYSSDQINSALREALKSSVQFRRTSPIEMRRPEIVPMERYPISRRPEESAFEPIPLERRPMPIERPVEMRKPEIAPMERYSMERPAEFTKEISGPIPMGLPKAPPMEMPPEKTVTASNQGIELTEAPSYIKPEEAQKEEKITPSMEITLEELIEGIIAERWEEFEDRLKIFDERDMHIENEISQLRKKISEIEEKVKHSEETLIQKFDDFGDSMNNIEGRIGSIETAFKEFIPTLTENVRAMSDIVEKMKKGKQE